MENYFNYFTEIEEHFQRRRGTLTLLSPLDWALMEIWKDAGIPLESVLRGIDASFDKWERRPNRTRKVNGLAYCAQEVLAAAEEMKEAAVGGGRPRKLTLELESATVRVSAAQRGGTGRRLFTCIGEAIAERNGRRIEFVAMSFAAGSPPRWRTWSAA